MLVNVYVCECVSPCFWVCVWLCECARARACVCVNVSVYLQQAGWQSHRDRGANEPHTVASHTQAGGASEFLRIWIRGPASRWWGQSLIAPRVPLRSVHNMLQRPWCGCGCEVEECRVWGRGVPGARSRSVRWLLPLSSIYWAPSSVSRSSRLTWRAVPVDSSTQGSLRVSGFA